MKKCLIFLAIALAFAVSWCGNDDSSDENDAGTDETDTDDDAGTDTDTDTDTDTHTGNQDGGPETDCPLPLECSGQNACVPGTEQEQYTCPGNQICCEHIEGDSDSASDTGNI